MVSFQTAEIYNEDQDNIIGVKVIVSADTGQVIDEIQVTNKTDFEELEAKLDALGDDYVQFADESPMGGSTIDAILANVSELFDINATTLGGFQSDDYAKTSHTHQKSSITNLYNYDISCSNYNLKLNGTSAETTSTISVKVTNMNNSPVSGHTVIIYKNGEVWVNGTTNNSGVFTTTFTADSPGLKTFAVNNQKVHLSVNDFRTTTLSPYTTNIDSGTFILERSGNNVIFRFDFKHKMRYSTDRVITVENIPNGYKPASTSHLGATVEGYRTENSEINPGKSYHQYVYIDSNNRPKVFFEDAGANYTIFVRGQLMWVTNDE